MGKFVCGLWIVVLALIAAPAAYADIRDGAVSGQTTLTTAPGCAQVPLNVCGTIFNAAAGPLGNLQSFHLPAGYVTDTATFQCVANGSTPFYQLQDAEVGNCAKRDCDKGSVDLCGLHIPVNFGAKAGDKITVQVPVGLLDPAKVTPPQNISVQCVQHTDGLYFDVVGGAGPNCNALMCQPIAVSACGASVNVTTPTAMGKVLDMTTSTGKSIKVECMGSLQGAPHFAVVDQHCN